MLPNLLLCGLNPQLLDTRKLILERCGYQVSIAFNPVNAQRIIQSRRVDLVILCHSLSTDECDQVRAFASLHSTNQDTHPGRRSGRVPRPDDQPNLRHERWTS